MPGVKGMKGGGGFRVGAGRKPKSAAILSLHGGRIRRGRAPAAPAVTEPVVPVLPPDGLPADQLAVWNMLAPHALLARTLTPGTAGSFRDLCQAVTLRDRLLAKIEEDGWTFTKVTLNEDGDVVGEELKKHPLVADQRAWEQRVEAGRARFMLAPIGKALMDGSAPKELSPLERLQAQAQQMKRK